MLLITADSANIITANITVVSLIPRDDDLFMVDPNNSFDLIELTNNKSLISSFSKLFL
ncbi:hypothetical protein HNQ55_003274 [Thalassotalea piscium]|uniref:Uncharacterized protein n=1 Tax=Thalassotalea piscium TaxID=1230533 RepID=A0A7X0TUX4_9GAMM|nr:hypothetical protein [Thalassotalea piscium]